MNGKPPKSQEAITGEKEAKAKRLAKLEEAIGELARAKGRHNTAIAYAKLMEQFQNGK